MSGMAGSKAHVPRRVPVLCEDDAVVWKLAAADERIDRRDDLYWRLAGPRPAEEEEEEEDDDDNDGDDNDNWFVRYLAARY